MALIYHARYLPMSLDSLMFPVTNISCFTVLGPTLLMHTSWVPESWILYLPISKHMLTFETGVYFKVGGP